MQSALLKAARLIRTPMFCAVAENDTQTESTRAICEAVRASRVPAEVKIYPPFTLPSAAKGADGVGHAIFGPEGVSICGTTCWHFYGNTWGRAEARRYE